MQEIGITKASWLIRLGVVVALGCSLGVASAASKSFTLGGVTLTLEEATTDLGVYYTSMRYNRAANVWNVEVSVTNRSSQTWLGPVVLLVESFSGTSGPLQPDGTDEAVKPFYELSSLVLDGELVPQETSLRRTLSIAFQPNSAPQLTTKVFARLPQPVAGLQVVRTLDGAGLPLPSVIVDSPGALGGAAQTDDAFGLATLTQTNATRVLKFSAPGFQPVWRIASVTSNGVGVIPHPRLTRRDTNTATLTPIAGGTLSRGSPPTEVSFTPGTFSQNTTARLTPLTGQTLPLFLPQGWSPLGAFWLELSAEPALAGSAALTPWGQISSSETAAFVRLNTNTPAWEVLQLVNGNGTNAISASLPGSGAYALVAPDAAPIAPPNPTVGSVLPSSTTPLPGAANLRAGGTVTPSSSPASKVPELVTAMAEVLVTNVAGNLPSGTLLRGEVSERYTLRDGTRRFPALFDNFVVGYQRPGDTRLDTVRAEFPIRPLLLFAAEELDEAVVLMDLFPPGAFTGGILDTNGGQVASAGLRVLAGLGDLLASQAVQLKRLDITNFTELAAGSNATVVAAFEIGVSGVAAGRKLVVQLSGLVTNANFVLARVLARDGLYGLEPRERLHSDGSGNLVSDEPAAGDRLPGLNGAGQYVLLKINPAQGLVSGIAKNSSGQPAGGLPMRIVGQPWLTFSANDGAFKLLAPAGDVTLTVTDLATGDSGAQIVNVPNPQTPVNTQLASVSSGPRVLSVTPTNNATSVSRVTPIVITFDEPVNPGSVIGTNVQLLGTTGTPVTASLTLNLKNTVATLLPTDPLAASTLFTLQLSTNITDPTGLKLEGQNVFSFTTESDTLNRVGARVDSYEPVNGRAAMTGSPGTADPNSPVILVNDTTGETATILSRFDGSFSNLISASLEDVLSAVVVNQNGTRTTIPVGRQLMQDGSVALFSGGGVVEAPGEHGTIQLLVEGGSIPNRTQFKVESVPLTMLQTVISNVPPTNTQPLGAFRLAVRGNIPKQALEVSFPVDPAQIQLVPGTTLEESGFVLMAVSEVDGVLAYHVIDDMKYENGRLVTKSPPLLTLVIGLLFLLDQISQATGITAAQTVITPGDVAADLFLSIGYLVNRVQFTVRGKVSQVAEVFDADDIPQSLQPGNPLNPNNATIPTGGRVLAGAIVTAVTVPRGSNILGGVTQLRDRRVVPGALYAISDMEGNYGIHIGIDDASGYVMTASHPVFPNMRVATPGPPFFGPRTVRVNLVFPDDPALSRDNGPPIVTVSHAPFRPPPGGIANVTASATDGDGRPTITLSVVSVTNLVATASNVVASGLNSSVIQVAPTLQQQISTRTERDTFTVSSTTNLELVVTLAAVGTDPTGLKATNKFTIPFGGNDAVGTNAIPPADPSDTVGPVVVWTWPAADAASWGPGVPLRVRFNEAVDRGSTTSPGAITVSPSAGVASLVLSDDQTELSLGYPDLKPSTIYQVTFTTAIQDIVGNHLDQQPGESGLSSHTISLTTAPIRNGTLSDIEYGGGAMLRGRYAYVLERRGDTEGALRVYDLNDPTDPTLVKSFNLPPFPRDFAMIPQYSFKRKTNGPVETKDIIAIAGGNVGGVPGVMSSSSGLFNPGLVSGGPWLWLVDTSDPANPALMAATLLSQNTLAVVPKLLWAPPMLGYLESSADFSSVGLINLQAFLISENVTPAEFAALPLEGTSGHDDDGNGDFVGPNDVLPLPSKFGGTFGGKAIGLSLGNARQTINDFAVGLGGFFVSVVVREGQELAPNGLPTGAIAPSAYQTLFAGTTLPRSLASLPFTNAVPYRVTHLFSQELSVSNQFEVRDLALVSLRRDSGSNALAVIDVADPLAPKLLNQILLPSGAVPFTVSQRDDGLLALATGSDVMLLDPRLLAEAGQNGGIPAMVGVIPGAGAGARTFGSIAAGLNAISLGSKNQLVQTAPAMRFVSSTNILPLGSLLTNAAPAQALAGMFEETSLFAARIKADGGAVSTISPPNPAFHYYVLVDAPGSSGQTIELGLESLNASGFPLKNKGRSFPPVRAVSADALSQIGQSVRAGCDLSIRLLTARRVSDNERSPLYNVYLSKPFALTYERMDQATLDVLRNELDREVLWSGHYLRAFIDTSMSGNPVIGAFAATSDPGPKVLVPRAEVVAEALPATYIMGPNPAGLAGAAMVPGTFGTVSAHNGEFRHDTIDMAVPSKRMPIVFQRFIRTQDLYEGPFGRGWDFNYHQHLTELRRSVFPSGSRKPLVLRNTPEGSAIGESRDVEFHTGEGRVVIFKRKGDTPPPELQSDPLVTQLGWKNVGATYYLPERGSFDLLFRFRDGQFARLTPDGMQFWYSQAGRLEKIYDRYPTNQHVLTYNKRGELARITDKAILNDARFLDIGYWRLNADSLFTGGLDDRTGDVFKAGRIRRLKDYTGRDVIFDYDADGVLLSREAIKASGANGGFSDRTKTIYLAGSGCSGDALGLIMGNGAAQTGTRLFAVDSANSAGMMTAGSGAAGPVTLASASPNTAASVGGTTANTSNPDGLKTDFTFDNNGYASQITFSGQGVPNAGLTMVHGGDGLLQSITYPEGNQIIYTYDTSTNLRSRANLMTETHVSGTRGGPTLTATYAYDNRYNLRSGTQRDFENNPITYTLTSDGRDVQSIAYPGAGTHSFVYNDNGQLEFETKPDGVTADPAYNPSTGFLTTHKLGPNTTSYGYDGTPAAQLGLPTTITPPRGAGIFVVYDDLLQVTSLTRGGLQDFRAYDANGNVTYLKRKVDTGTFYEESRSYNQFNFLLTLTIKNVEVDGVAQNLPFVFTPDTAFRVKDIIYPGGATRTLTYNRLGHATKMVLGGGGGASYTEDYGRDKHGSLTALTQGGEVTRTFGYDGHDRLVGVTNKSDGGDQVMAISYHGNGTRRKTTITDPLYGPVYESEFTSVDALGRPTQESRSGTLISASVGYTYPAGGGGGSVVMSGPRTTTTVAHDSAGFPDFFDIQSLLSVDYIPDRNGNVEFLDSTENGRTYHTQYFYDDLDHLERQRDDGQLVFEQVLRPSGAPSSITDGGGHTTLLEHTVLGEPKRVQRPSGVAFQTHYSAQRQPRFTGDGTGAGHHADYDNTFRATSMTLRDGSQIDYNSPDARNLPTQVQLPGGGGGTRTLSYDRQGRTLSHLTGFGGVSYRIPSVSYDAIGRVREIHYGDSGQFSATFGYDLLGPLTSATYNEAFGAFATSYSINSDGSYQQVDYPSGLSVQEDRPPSGQLTGVQAGGNDIYRVTDFAGVEMPRTVQLGGSVIRERNEYDGRRRMVARRFERASDGALLADVRYQYDGANNRRVRQFLHRHGRADLFGYDNDNRLTRADLGARPVVANAAARTLPGFLALQGFLPGLFSRDFSYSTDNLDKLTNGAPVNPTPALLPPLPPFATNITAHDGFLFARTVDGLNRTPDALGNAASTRLQVRPPFGSDPTPFGATLVHNAFSQLVRVERVDGVVIEYQYQPTGLIHHRKVTDGSGVLSEVAMVYDRGRLIEEYERVSGTNQVRARYYYANTDYPVAADLRDGSGALRRYYFLCDAQGSVMAVADDAGNVVERVHYDAFGQPQIEARDTSAPRVAFLAVGLNNELLIHFTERVMPPLVDTSEGTDFRTVTAPLGGAVSILTSNSNTGGAVIYDEAGSGAADFGALMRFQSSVALPNNFTLQLNAGLVTDEWGNSNLTQLIIVTNLGPPGTVLVQGAGGAGATAPQRLARSSIGNPFLFHGQYFDYDAGLLYLRARFYDPYTGHFLERDPLGYADSVNLYAGFAYNPTSYRDPTGMAPSGGTGGRKGGSTPSGGGAGEPPTPPPARPPASPHVPRTRPEPSTGSGTHVSATRPERPGGPHQGGRVIVDRSLYNHTPDGVQHWRAAAAGEVNENYRGFISRRQLNRAFAEMEAAEAAAADLNALRSMGPRELAPELLRRNQALFDSIRNARDARELEAIGRANRVDFVTEAEAKAMYPGRKWRRGYVFEEGDRGRTIDEADQSLVDVGLLRAARSGERFDDTDALELLRTEIRHEVGYRIMLRVRGTEEAIANGVAEFGTIGISENKLLDGLAEDPGFLNSRYFRWRP